MGILWTRIGRGVNYNSARHHPNYSLMVGAYRILKKCKTPRSKKMPGCSRSAEQWARLRARADELVALLAPLGNGAGAPQSFGAPGTDAGTLGAGTPAPAGATLADGSDGEEKAMDTEEAAAACQKAQRQAQPQQAQQANGAGTGAGSGGDTFPMNAYFYHAIRPLLTSAVERMMLADEADGAADGFLSGTSLGRGIERAALDGRCFSRKVAEGERLNAVVLLDKSSSMTDSIQTVLGLAQAFLDALNRTAESVQAAQFDHEVWPVANFHGATNLGGTVTHKALDWADKALKGKPGRRVCVVITDGASATVDATRASCQLLCSHGVTVIGIAYQCGEATIARTMPGAEIIAAKNPGELAMRLARVAATVAAR
jgi:hypothetical protein